MTPGRGRPGELLEGSPVGPSASRQHLFPMCYGPEFVSESFQIWLKKVGVKPIRIYPGSPRENGYNERFNGTLRREVLNTEWFISIDQARTVIGKWLKQYNQIRPHQALGMHPPVPETLSENGT